MEAMEMQGELLHGGVLPYVYAEGEDVGGIGDVDLGNEGGESFDDGNEQLEHDGQNEGNEQLDQTEEKIDGRKGSKEFRDALKAWEATPEGAKFAKTARNDHFRLQEVNTIEPGGVAALREKYALIESVGGVEGITQIQERVAEFDATDAMIASGDPKALESMGPEFDSGLAKLTPTILDRVMKANPEAYAAALLPHLMTGLMNTPMVGDLNRMIDILQAPHLDEAGKIKAITDAMSRIGQWFDVNEKKAGQLKSAPADAKANDLTQREQAFEQQQQQAHWTNNIAPAVTTYEKGKLEELFKPFDTRLKLDPAAKADLFATFREKIKAAGQADAAYMKQMGIYRKQKNPDAAVVQNFVKSAINRHAKTVVETAVKARYGRFLGAQKKPGAAVVPGARASAGRPGAAVVMVSMKPSVDEIDYRNTTEADQWNKIYTLKNGKRVQVRKAS